MNRSITASMAAHLPQRAQDQTSPQSDEMIPKEHVEWAYRLLLDREPESAAVVTAAMQCQSTKSLVDSILASAEFRSTHSSLSGLQNHWVMLEAPLEFRIWINLADRAVSGAILNGGFEGGETAFVKKNVKPGQTALDIGSNIGFYALLMSSLVGTAGRVIGFEPLPLLHAAAMKSVYENRFYQCQIHNVALGSKRSSANLIYAPDSSNWGGAFLSFDDNTPMGHVSNVVPVAPLTDYVMGVKADFIKIDVEGAEMLIMAGCADYLRAHRPTIMSEVHSSQLVAVSGSSTFEYVQFMRSLGYTCRPILASGDLGDQMTGSEKVDLVNVAFVPS